MQIRKKCMPFFSGNHLPLFLEHGNFQAMQIKMFAPHGNFHVVHIKVFTSNRNFQAVHLTVVAPPWNFYDVYLSVFAPPGNFHIVHLSVIAPSGSFHASKKRLLHCMEVYPGGQIVKCYDFFTCSYSQIKNGGFRILISLRYLLE